MQMFPTAVRSKLLIIIVLKFITNGLGGETGIAKTLPLGGSNGYASKSYLLKNFSPVPNFINIHLIRAKLFQTDRQTGKVTGIGTVQFFLASVTKNLTRICHTHIQILFTSSVFHGAEKN